MNDIEIASLCTKKDILTIAKELGLDEDSVIQYGKYKAKIKANDIMKGKNGKLILVTAINPTPYGEGKTTVSIGLTDALRHIDEKAIAVLREPSLGPVFGLKGGATGGGYSQVVPMEDINLHFTGDLHAITSANNLIAAAIDNHIYQGNLLDIDHENITFKRCLDVNDRALREIETDTNNGYARDTGFDITAASEVMSVFCLSKDLNDLKRNLGKIIVAKNKDGLPIKVSDLKLEGALVVLLKDAFDPNLVQTLENNPVLIHGGPFANIAHGCNSIVATNLALKLADYVVTEAGFGSDLGALKFMDIKCRKAGLEPDCIVLTATIRALKYNGYGDNEIDKLKNGLPNLQVHIENSKKFTSHIIVCLNKFDSDTDEEIEIVKNYCDDNLVQFSICETYSMGGIGAIALADKVKEICSKERDFKLLYDESLSITEKVEIICKQIYHASKVNYTDTALRNIEFINKIGEAEHPVCIAKTQYSISDDPKKLGFPKDFEVLVRDVKLQNGAGFITVYLGKILTMPGLPKSPNYEKIDLDDSLKITGLF